MIKIVTQYELQQEQEKAKFELNTALNSGYSVVAAFSGWSGMIILHKPDENKSNPRRAHDLHDDEKEFEAAAAPKTFVNHVQKQAAERKADTDAGNYPNTLNGFKAMVTAGDYVVLDTETTGLTDGEICQIAIADANETVLLDTLIKTTQPIPAGATDIHGITDNDVANSPTWAEVQPVVRDILNGRNVIIYNATYDRKMMHKSDERSGLERTDYKAEATYWDGMAHYAEYFGEWNNYHGNYRWQKLTNAARQCGIATDNAHSALGDVLMTIGVIRHMATTDETDTTK